MWCLDEVDRPHRGPTKKSGPFRPASSSILSVRASRICSVTSDTIELGHAQSETTTSGPKLSTSPVPPAVASASNNSRNGLLDMNLGTTFDVRGVVTIKTRMIPIKAFHPRPDLLSLT